MGIVRMLTTRALLLATTLLALFFIASLTQVDFTSQIVHNVYTKAYCLLYDPWLMGIYGVADTVTWISFWVISFYYLRLRRLYANEPSIRGTAIRQACWWLALLIFLVGLNHLFDTLLLHYRVYVWLAFVKAAMATVGFYVAFFAAPRILGTVLIAPRWATGTSEDFSVALARGVQLEELIGFISDGVVLVDDREKITYVNPAAERIFGYTASELIDRPLIFLIPSRYHAAHKRGIAAMRSGEIPRVRTVPLAVVGLHHNGGELQLEVAITSWQQENGSWHGGAFIRDATWTQAPPKGA